MPSDDTGCQACEGRSLREIEGFGRLPRVTSDSKPYAAGGRLFACPACGLAQKVPDAVWRRETAEIYRDYEMHHQSGAADQPVFDPQTGRPQGRCEALARRLRDIGNLPPKGAMIDVGAGNGAMLAAFSHAFPAWTLHGTDLDERRLPALRSIPGFVSLFTGPVARIRARFDLVTLVHSLEHFPDPWRTLQDLHERLHPGGRIFIEVNDASITPFDFVVADHLCHFEPRTLARLIGRAGFRIEHTGVDWVSKEISLLASEASEPEPAPTACIDGAGAVSAVEAGVRWLGALLDDAVRIARLGPFGIFGTSVAATWLASGLRDAVQFFVDEDPARTARKHLGRPIIRPEEVPGGSNVYLAFAPSVAESIRRRLAHLKARFVLPPARGAPGAGFMSGGAA